MRADHALSFSRVDDLAAILRGDAPWHTLARDASGFASICSAHEVTGLVQAAISRGAIGGDWPADVRDALACASRTSAAGELLRRREIGTALDALAAADADPILFKGTALAYSVYPEPMARPRVDTDLIVGRDRLDAARRALTACGYTAAVQCGGELVLRQEAWSKTDNLGIEHTLDLHWSVSTQPIFRDLVTYEELAADAVAIERLGRHARGPGAVHALLLACVHPAMHHRHAEWLIWVSDVHLLASRLSEAEFYRFTSLAIGRRVAAIASQELNRAHRRFGTRIPERVMRSLGAAETEPSADYLRDGRRWHDDLVSSVRALRWRDRVRLMREVLVPDARYMRARYRMRRGWPGAVALPAAYLHRGVRGALNVLTGRK